MPNHKFFQQKIFLYLACPMMLIGCPLATGSLLAFANDGVLSEASIERAGLTVDWLTQLDIGARSKIVNLQLQVNEDKTTRYYLVEYDGRVERISQYELDAFGKPRGIEGAEAYANVRKEVIEAELAAQGRGDVAVTVNAISLPQVTIYAVDGRGKAIAVDADTGQQLWAMNVGDRRNPCFGIGTSKNHVAVAVGTNVFCLSAENGKLLWSQQCENAPAAPPAVGQNQIYIPLITGRLQVFDIDNEGIYPKSYVSYGNSVAKPLVTDRTVSWATSDGYYSVAPVDPKEGRSVKYHLHSGGSFDSGAAYHDGVFYVNSVEGSVFAINEIKGSLNWEYPTGDRIITPPFIAGNALFIITTDNNLFKLDIKTGRLADGWAKPVAGISQFVGLSDGKIFALNRLGELIAIDSAGGAVMHRIASRPLTLVIPNTLSDRLYVGSERGLLQCIREQTNPFPHYDTGGSSQVAADGAAKQDDQTQPPAAKDDPFATDDPFALDSDPQPADSGKKTMDPEDDPFATDDDDSDPFAADEEDNRDDSGGDPFAGDAGGDPFADDDSDGGGGNDDPFADDDSDGDSGGGNDDPFADGGSP